MVTDTKYKIIKYLKDNGKVRVRDLVSELKISPVAVHKQLRNLQKEGEIKKIGKTPQVFYVLNEKLSIDQIKEKIVPVLKESGVKKSALFGSYVRGQEKPESDIDILVDLPPSMSLFDVIALQNRLEKELNKKIDLVEYSAIKPRLRDYILNEQIQII